MVVSVHAAAAQSDTLTGRVSKLEQEVVGHTSRGSLLERLQQLEIRLNGTAKAGTIPPRLKALESLVNGPPAYAARDHNSSPSARQSESEPNTDTDETPHRREGSSVKRIGRPSPEYHAAPAADAQSRANQMRKIIQARITQAMGQLGVSPIPDLEAPDTSMAVYRTYVLLSLAPTWEPARTGLGLIAVVTIAKDGTIESTEITRSSGDAHTDTSALNAIKALKLVPLPAWYHGVNRQLMLQFDNVEKLKVWRAIRIMFKMRAESRIHGAFLLALLCLLHACPASATKIAVLPLDFETARKNAGNIDIGNELARVIAAKLRKSGKYKVIAPAQGEREAPGLQARARLDESIEFGRRAGAQIIVTGSVRQFDLELPSKINSQVVWAVARGAARVAPIPYASSAVSTMRRVRPRNSQANGKVKVDFDVRVTNIMTGEAMLIATGKGTSQATASSLFDGVKNPDFTSSRFEQTAAGQATMKAVDKVVNQVTDAEPKITAELKQSMLGQITDIDSDLICIDAGKDSGLKKGTILKVERPQRASEKDGARTRAIGTIEVTDVAETTSIARIDSGSSPMIGDLIKPTPTITPAPTLLQHQNSTEK